MYALHAYIWMNSTISSHLSMHQSDKPTSPLQNHSSWISKRGAWRIVAEKNRNEGMRYLVEALPIPSSTSESHPCVVACLDTLLCACVRSKTATHIIMYYNYVGIVFYHIHIRVYIEIFKMFPQSRTHRGHMTHTQARIWINADR